MVNLSLRALQQANDETRTKNISRTMKINSLVTMTLEKTQRNQVLVKRRKGFISNKSAYSKRKADQKRKHEFHRRFLHTSMISMICTVFMRR